MNEWMGAVNGWSINRFSDRLTDQNFLTDWFRLLSKMNQDIQNVLDQRLCSCDVKICNSLRQLPNSLLAISVFFDLPQRLWGLKHWKDRTQRGPIFSDKITTKNHKIYCLWIHVYTKYSAMYVQFIQPLKDTVYIS